MVVLVEQEGATWTSLIPWSSARELMMIHTVALMEGSLAIHSLPKCLVSDLVQIWPEILQPQRRVSTRMKSRVADFFMPASFWQSAFRPLQSAATACLK